MADYTVYFVRREWVSVDVSRACCPEQAVTKARKKLEVCHEDVGVMDGKCEVAGYCDDSLIKKIDK